MLTKPQNLRRRQVRGKRRGVRANWNKGEDLKSKGEKRKKMKLSKIESLKINF